MNSPLTPQKGVVSVITAILITVLIGFLAMAVDFGYQYVQRNRAQNIADAAALACVIQNSDTVCGSFSSSYTIAAPNIVLPANTSTTITNVNNYGFDITTTLPVACPLATENNCASAVATKTWPTFFLQVIGFPTLSVTAIGKAGTVGGAPGCLVALSNVNVIGHASITGTNCANYMGGVSYNGSTSITANANYLFNGRPSSDCGICVPAAISNAGPLTDPSNYSNMPTPSTTPSRVNPGCKNATCNLLPGYYPTGIDCSGSNATCIFASGTYFLGGPFLGPASNGTATDNGAGVLLYMEGSGGQGNISLAGGGTVTFTDLGKSGTNCATTDYNQVVFYSPSTTTGNTFSLQGTPSSKITGNIDLPSYTMAFGGNSAANIAGSIVVQVYNDTGGGGSGDLVVDPSVLKCQITPVGGRISLVQ